MMIQNFNICVTKQDFEILFSIQKIFMAAAINFLGTRCGCD